MSEDMVERVAKALQDACVGWEDHVRQGAAWPMLARAAISAMREPTLSMKMAAWAEARSIDAAEAADVPYDFRGNDRTGAVFKAMIDAALAR